MAPDNSGGQAHFEGQKGDGSYFMVANEAGNMFCSCGRSLVKLDDDHYKCSGGYPVYRPGKDEVRVDKFGNLMLKVKSHDPDVEERAKKLQGK